MALAVRAPLLLQPGFVIDQTQFMRWAELSRDGGLASVYGFRDDGSRRLCNYPPAYLYVLKSLAPLSGWISGEKLDSETIYAVYKRSDTPEVRVAAAVFKLPAVLADLATVLVLIVVLAPRIGRSQALAIGAVYAVLPAVMHNSAVWGQVDAIHTLLMVVSLEMLLQRRYFRMTCFAVLAVLTKAQAIVLAPLWFVPVLMWAGRDWRRWGGVALSCGVIAIPILLPFATVLSGVWEAYKGAASYYPFVHLNGFSAWFVANPMVEPHLDQGMTQWYMGDNSASFLHLTARQWGMIGFVVFSTFVMLRLATRRCNTVSLRWAARTLPLAFFVLSTQMHERYLFPAIAIWAWGAAVNRRWWGGWLLLSVCVSINCLWAWPGPPDSWWTAAATAWLHRPGVGLTCSLAIVVLFALSIANWFEPRERPAPSDEPPSTDSAGR